MKPLHYPPPVGRVMSFSKTVVQLRSCHPAPALAGCALPCRRSLTSAVRRFARSRTCQSRPRSLCPAFVFTHHVQAPPQVSGAKSKDILPCFCHKSSGLLDVGVNPRSGNFQRPVFRAFRWRRTETVPKPVTVIVHRSLLYNRDETSAPCEKSVDIQTGLWYKLVEFRDVRRSQS
jgi:hypothetical protein